MKAMNAKNGLPMRWLVTACALAMVLTLPQAGMAQQAPAAGAAKPDTSKFESVPLSSLMPGEAPARPTAKPNAEEEESPQPNSAGHQSIKVHGHWVIDLKDPDGKVVEHRDFQNSLVQSSATTGIGGGDWLLANFLSGNATPGGFSIVFVNTTTNTDPTSFCISANNCYFFSSSNNADSIAYNGTTGLISTVVLANGTTNLTSSLVLSGAYTIPAGLTTITAVQTWLSYCEPTASQSAPGFLQADLAPSGCVASAHPVETVGFAPLTSTSVTSGTPPVATPLNVTPGQVISVKVTISFS